jgi:hypothetical protein
MLLTEAKNNKNKMARWTVEAVMSGAEAIKWGYVSRAGPRDNSNHAVLNVQVGEGAHGRGNWRLRRRLSTTHFQVPVCRRVRSQTRDPPRPGRTAAPPLRQPHPTS